MKITGIIGFILMLLMDIALFFTSMNMPASSKTGGAFLILALIQLILILIYFISAIKKKYSLTLIASILLILSPIGSFLIMGKYYDGDVKEYGKYLNFDTSFKIYIILITVSLIFGVLGIVLSSMDKRTDRVKEA